MRFHGGMLRRRWLTAVSFLCLLAGGPVAHAYTPQSPEVQSMVRRGIAVIEARYAGEVSHHAAELGGVCAAGLACYKFTGNPNHPVVQAAVAKCKQEVGEGFDQSGHSNYSLGIALIFLGDLDPLTYATEMEALVKEVVRKQTSWGAWTYPSYETGDTSQTQFAVLGLWMAARQGIEVPRGVLERGCNWLLRTQAPDGGFGYQGKDPGTFTRIAQERTTESMGTAGTATLYVCGELLGFIQPDRARLQTTPAALRAVQSEAEASVETTVDRELWREAIRLGDGWIRANGNIENRLQGRVFQQYYYMYTVERYWAFRELAEGSVDKEPSWYNSGVEYLRGKQGSDGSWAGDAGAAVDTAFACLYLLRTSQKTVNRIVRESGTVRGGKNLPDDLTNPLLDARGNVVTLTAAQPIDDLLKMLEDPNSPAGDFFGQVPDELALSTDPQQRSSQLIRLRRMAVNGSFQARLAAVRTLGTVRDLDNAPALIYALSDPDWRVSQAARDGLRFLSRKLDGFGFEIVPGKRPERHQWQQAQRTWSQWLLSIKPDAVLLQ